MTAASAMIMPYMQASKCARTAPRRSSTCGRWRRRSPVDGVREVELGTARAKPSITSPRAVVSDASLRHAQDLALAGSPTAQRPRHDAGPRRSPASSHDGARRRRQPSRSQSLTARQPVLSTTPAIGVTRATHCTRTSRRVARGEAHHVVRTPRPVRPSAARLPTGRPGPHTDVESVDSAAGLRPRHPLTEHQSFPSAATLRHASGCPRRIAS
jgi:hypothetical protein